jgi:peptidoglycan/LPS O-acetylase OafA/YrhL
MTAPDTRLRGHMPPLDGVRGIAILMVMAVHLWTCVQPSNAIERAIGRVVGFGLLGVDLFFVLSGFLITGILIEAKGSEGYFRTFYMRRALRIFPLYYGVLVLMFVVAPLVPALRGPDLDFLVGHQAWAWLYAVNVYNAIHGLSFPYINHLWSLGVEEHFYFVWPLLVWAVPREKLLPVSAAVVLASLGLRVAGAFAGLSYSMLYELTPFRLDQLAFGGLLAIAARQGEGLEGLARTMKRAAPAAIVLLVGLFALDAALHERWSPPIHHVRTAMWTVLFGALIVAAVGLPATHPLSRFLRSRPMVGLGKYSYGLYVFHHFVSSAFVKYGVEAKIASRVGSHTLAGIAVVALGFAASLGMALVSFRFYETRFLEMKRAWAPRQAVPAPGDVTAH